MHRGIFNIFHPQTTASGTALHIIEEVVRSPMPRFPWLS